MVHFSKKLGARGGYILIFLWLALTGLLAFVGFYSHFELPPRIPPFVLLEFGFLIWLSFFSSYSRNFLKIEWGLLLLPQLFRIPVEIALADLANQGLLPPEMSYHGRNFDIVVGITAPIAYLFSRLSNQNLKHILLSLWNGAGIAILSVVVFHGLASMPYPFQLLPLEPSSSVLMVFPLQWLPFFLAPFAYFLHFASLRKIWLERKERN